MNFTKKNRLVNSVLMLLCIIGFWLFENFYTPATYSNPNGNSEITNEEFKLLPKSKTGNIVSHEFFTLSYSEPHEQAEWVAYFLEKSHLTYDDRKRPYFIEDPKVVTKSADWRNYKGSGYDRGHLCPAGDRRFSEYAYNETFYTSNISPQNRDFNGGIWNRLEMKVRYWAKKYGKVFVVTGGVLEDNLKEIGDEGVDVPKYFYKIILKEEGDNVEVIAFLMRNEESKLPLKKFVTSIDVIEQKTGLNFFEALPDKVENKIEAQIKTNNWKF